jgi:DNA primase
MESILQHLVSRHVDLNLHRPVMDETERVATFFLYNLSGQIVGYQQYRPDASKDKKNNPREGRYFTYRPKHTIAVWGLESLDLRNGLVFVTEGIFDAARLTELGQPALAVLSNDPSVDTRNFLNCLGRRVVAVCDPDRAGRKLAKVGHHAEIMPAEHDLGDAPAEFVRQLISKYQ